jgi:competence protein ComEC
VSTNYSVPIWRKAPFIRLLLPLVLGILLQWYLSIPVYRSLIALLCFGIAYRIFLFFPLVLRYKLRALQAIVINLVLICLGLLITWQKDIRNSNAWMGRYYQQQDYLVIRIDESPQQKEKSWKVNGQVEKIIQKDSSINCKGKLLLYFSKDSISSQLKYGDRILVNKKLQEIKNSGNPGAFNYQQYAAMQLVFHQLYLKPSDWVKLEGVNTNQFKQFIINARTKILSILRKNLPPKKDELGIAEALLIGYTSDLDRDLVKAYSNTGVVHIIAISGMHLGLIYILLGWIFCRMPAIKKSKILQLVLMLTSLWLFAILTGAAASVIRSAVMFTFIAIGKAVSKKSSIFNSMAASAFVMLCYNPYFLWDVGFQLSYLAVIGIIIFQATIYNWIYFKNKIANEVWKLMAISLAAQVFTFPICIYYFHQFPNYFLLTNIIAVPLSSAILFMEIGLVALAWIPWMGEWLGKLVGALLWLMNQIILWVSELPFSVWEKIPATLVSTALLYLIVFFFCSWLMKKSKIAFRISLISLLAFTLLQSYGEWRIKNQQKVIVYNIPQHQAIDFIRGNQFKFLGDSGILGDQALQNFHIKPARVALQLTKPLDTFSVCHLPPLFYQLGNQKIVLIDRPMQMGSLVSKIDVDMIILSKNVKIVISQLASVFNCKQYVFDASNSLWKIGQWQKDCEELHLRSYSVAEKGAFVLTEN